MHTYFTKDIYIYKMSHFNFYYFYFTPYLIYNHNTLFRTEDPRKVFGLQHLHLKNYFKTGNCEPALYGQKCRTPICWIKLIENKLIEPDIVKDTKEKVQIIQQSLKASSDRHTSYVDLKRKDIEYEVGDKVFLKVSPWRKVLRFGKKAKLSLRFIGPYEILERV